MVSIYESIVGSGMPVTLPTDVFSVEDCEKIDGGVRLYSLNNMPDVLVDYVLYADAKRYFDGGNTVDLVCGSDGWTICFNGNLSNYGTSITGDDEKRKMFIEDNDGFIHSFVDAINAYLGEGNVSLYDADIIL